MVDSCIRALRQTEINSLECEQCLPGLHPTIFGCPGRTLRSGAHSPLRRLRTRYSLPPGADAEWYDRNQHAQNLQLLKNRSWTMTPPVSFFDGGYLELHAVLDAYLSKPEEFISKALHSVGYPKPIVDSAKTSSERCAKSDLCSPGS